MTNLITEARELCSKATPGPWQVKLHNEDYGQGYGETTFFVDMGGTLLKIGVADSAEKYAQYSGLSTIVARSHTLIPELCDALEKAQEQNKQLLHEVCKLACESVERDKALARLEAEVEGWAKAEQEGRLLVLPCKVGDCLWDTSEGFLQAFTVHFFDNDYVYNYAENWMGSYVIEKHKISDFGKTVFLTRAEAEAVLGREGE